MTALPSPVGTATVTPIARSSLHAEVTARVRDLIVEGHLVPG
jgi:hypothetical protein